jgi:hypothetical protein
MNGTKRLKGFCTECGGPIEFLAEAIGTTAQCPRCRKQTELLLAPPPAEPLVPRKVIVWTAVTSAVLILGAIGVVMGLNHFEKLATQQKQRSDASQPGMPAGLQVSGISVASEPGASESYAVGTVANISNVRRLGLTIQLDLLDAAGQKVGVARAYRPALDAGAKWEFKVATGDAKAVGAKLTSIKEGQ